MQNVSVNNKKIKKEDKAKTEKINYITSSFFLTLTLICFILSLLSLFIKALPSQSLGCALGFIFFMMNHDTNNNKALNKIFSAFAIIAFAGIFLMFVPKLAISHMFAVIYNLILYFCIVCASLLSALYLRKDKTKKYQFIMYFLIFIFSLADVCAQIVILIK